MLLEHRQLLEPKASHHRWSLTKYSCQSLRNYLISFEVLDHPDPVLLEPKLRRARRRQRQTDQRGPLLEQGDAEQRLAWLQDQCHVEQRGLGQLGAELLCPSTEQCGQGQRQHGHTGPPCKLVL
jgi:hypothetical protein